MFCLCCFVPVTGLATEGMGRRRESDGLCVEFDCLGWEKRGSNGFYDGFCVLDVKREKKCLFVAVFCGF